MNLELARSTQTKMNIDTLGNAHIFLIHPAHVYHDLGCYKCRKVLETTKDKYLIGLIIQESGQEFRYFLGVNPPIICCGQKQNIFQTFRDESEAWKEIERIRQHLQIHQSTQGLTLHQIVQTFAGPGAN